MDHRPFLSIWRGAYLGTLKRLKQIEHRMGGDLAARGMRLDLTRATAVAERLGSTVRPTLGDFFPDGKVQIRCPPLVGQQG